MAAVTVCSDFGAQSRQGHKQREDSWGPPSGGSFIHLDPQVALSFIEGGRVCVPSS